MRAEQATLQAEQLENSNTTLRRNVRPHHLESDVARLRHHRTRAPPASGSSCRRYNYDDFPRQNAQGEWDLNNINSDESDGYEDGRVSQATVQDTDDEPVREPFKSEDHQDGEDDEQAGGAGGAGLSTGLGHFEEFV